MPILGARCKTSLNIKEILHQCSFTRSLLTLFTLYNIHSSSESNQTFYQNLDE